MTIPLHKLSKEEYDKSFEYALKLYNEKLTGLGVDSEKCSIGQTDRYPMHPQLFYQLSMVKGFNDCNGERYDVYLDEWITNHSS